MNRYFLIFAMAFLSIALIECACAEDVFKYGITNSFAKSCIFNGTWCSNSAVCNLTMTNSNGSILIDNALMTNQISFHNYTLPNLEVGYYKIDMVCSDSGYSGANSWYIRVTPTGDILTLQQSILLVLLMIFLVGCLIFTFMKGFKGGSYGVIIGYFLASYVIVLILTFLCYRILYDYVPSLYYLANILYYAMFIIMILFVPILLLVISTLVINMLSNKREAKLLNMGYTPEEINKRK